MDCKSSSIAYEQAGHFSRIITDYLAQNDLLKPFYAHPVSYEGISDAIAARKEFPTNRQLLVDELQKQYEHIPLSAAVQSNIQALAENNTFTIVTAHQPNIFTGYLYFIYKILHVIKISEACKERFPESNFVPVFYMGSEDADLDELGKIYLGGEKIVWDTKQKGAVGRMSTKGLDKIVARIEGELGIHKHGAELVKLLKDSYNGNNDIQTATFQLINYLFAEYGLIVLLPDNANLKRVMLKIFREDLWNQTPSTIVEKTNEQLSINYKVQANPREINLFYIKDDIRERIIKTDGHWKVVGQNIEFSEQELENELTLHPERFSPNVILRGLYQEMILPNIAFVGGGGETAYWLELKDLFNHYEVPFPMLILRNSFLFIEKQWSDMIEKLGFTAADFFKEERLLADDLVHRESTLQLNLKNELATANKLYDHLKEVAGKIDNSMVQHVDALRAKAIKDLAALEKKLLKSEKRKFDAQLRHISKVKQALFPNNSLQERTDNFMPYYAQYGVDFIRTIYQHSPTLEQKFVITSEV